MPAGYWCPVLHAHLPYVRHPEHAHFLEEDWFYEALTETYIPLVRVLDGLVRDGVDYRLTLTLSPTLLSMMTDSLLVERYHGYLDRLIELCERELDRTRRQDVAFVELARFYLAEFTDVRHVFREWHGSNLVRALAAHRASGQLEIITCCATHGFLPLMESVPGAARAQVLIGVEHYRGLFGTGPRGIWLPECGYMPGHERYLREAGLSYSFLEAHGLTHAYPRPTGGVLAPIISPGGVVFFGRDMQSSRQVWSSESGYPGDYDYREFYKDVGWDLPLDYLKDFLGDGMRRNLGLKYYRITGPVGLGQKQPYEPDRARERAARHAEHFLDRRIAQVREAPALSQPPVIVSPYDAELFGHWWFEGPIFLDQLLRKLHFDQDTIEVTTPPEFLDRYPECEVAQPPMSTWGAQGYAEVWLNPGNDWIYPHLDMAAERMVALARRYDAPGPQERRALDQAARELLLAQSSDWAFIMKTGTTVEYAHKRTRDHLARFTYLYEALPRGRVDPEVLSRFEKRDNLFPGLDYEVYAGRLAEGGRHGQD